LPIVSFASVPDAKCLDCHAQRPHSEFEVRNDPVPRLSRRAPRAPVVAPLSGQACVDCHRRPHQHALSGRRGPRGQLRRASAVSSRCATRAGSCRAALQSSAASELQGRQD
jgi:hypothetical protein